MIVAAAATFAGIGVLPVMGSTEDIGKGFDLDFGFPVTFFTGDNDKDGHMRSQCRWPQVLQSGASMVWREVPGLSPGWFHGSAPGLGKRRFSNRLECC
jgi:hypothetical protein